MTKTTHACGGTILTSGGAGEHDHLYCDRCGAYAYLLGRDVADVEVPSGTDADANRAAFDAGDDESPEAAS